MPYDAIEELPKNVRSVLPEHAQEIFRAAFNNAWDEYGQNDVRARKVAWAAVKKQYEKSSSGRWVAKGEKAA